MEKADELVGLYVARGLKPEPAPQSGHSVAHVQEVCALEETVRELIVKAKQEFSLRTDSSHTKNANEELTRFCDYWCKYRPGDDVTGEHCIMKECTRKTSI